MSHHRSGRSLQTAAFLRNQICLYAWHRGASADRLYIRRTKRCEKHIQASCVSGLHEIYTRTTAEQIAVKQQCQPGDRQRQCQRSKPTVRHMSGQDAPSCRVPGGLDHRLIHPHPRACIASPWHTEHLPHQHRLQKLARTPSTPKASQMPLSSSFSVTFSKRTARGNELRRSEHLERPVLESFPW